MWIYVPNCEPSRSVAAEAASTSASNWRSQALARFASWRGKPMPPQFWSKRCTADSWLRRLYGRMSPPSEADPGVERWIASLGVSHVSPIPSPAAAAAAATSATSGPTPDGSSSKPAPGSSSSRTSPACSAQARTRSQAPNGLDETYRDWVIRLRADFSRRRKLARARNASGSSSSAWPTATANMSTGPGSSGRDGGDNLQTAATRWPTPGTEERTESPATFAARRAKISPAKRMGPNGTLGMAVQRWSTPRASDGEKGGPNQSFGAGGQPLPSQAVMWNAPTVASATGGQANRGGDRQEELLLAGQARATSSRLDPTTMQDGSTSSKDTRNSSQLSLNPFFVAWLMGWVVLESNGSGYWVMGSCPYKRHLRSALSQLGSPPAAPLAQSSLF
jgi:hypothetical protein